jgi:hypothetical protein
MLHRSAELGVQLPRCECDDWALIEKLGGQGLGTFANGSLEADWQISSVAIQICESKSVEEHLRVGHSLEFSGTSPANCKLAGPIAATITVTLPFFVIRR